MMTHHSLSMRLETCFQRIASEQMQGMPVLNPAIQVQAVGFRRWRGFELGVIITPWFMSLLLLPGIDDDWEGFQLGDAQTHSFPNMKYDFTINEFEGLGRCQTHALHSPMFKFDNHRQAVEEAERVLAVMMEKVEPAEADPEEERLRRFLAGDESALTESSEETKSDPQTLQQVKKDKSLSRRNLLRGGE